MMVHSETKAVDGQGPHEQWVVFDNPLERNGKVDPRMHDLDSERGITRSTVEKDAGLVKDG